MLVLCRAGRDQTEPQRTRLGVRRWKHPGPQPAWHPGSHPRRSTQAGAKGRVGCGRVPPPVLTPSRRSPGSRRKSAMEKTPSPKATVLLKALFVNFDSKYVIFLFSASVRDLTQ